MLWIRANFKDKCKVWARCDSAGKLLEEGGRIEIKYSPKDKRTYSAAMDNLAPLSGCTPVEGEQPPAEPREAGAGQGSGGRKPDLKTAPKSQEHGRSEVCQRPPSQPFGPDAALGQATLPKPSGTAPKRQGAKPGERIIIYTDGASLGNPGAAGCAVHMAYRNRAKRAWRYLGQTTSNVAELEAVVLALSLVKDPAFPLTIHSDSTYVIGLLSRGWKAKENVELVRKVRLLLGRFADVRFVKVPGHAGVPANELVDQLAKEAAQTGQSGQA